MHPVIATPELTKIAVNYEAHMGDDLMVVNAARASFGRRSQWFYTFDGLNVDAARSLKPQDVNLLAFLARGMDSTQWDKLLTEAWDAGSKEELADLIAKMRHDPHWTPFAHPHITLTVRAPIYVTRQLYKHKIGMVESEMSRRYATKDIATYSPEGWHKAGSSNKQGSADEFVDGWGEARAADGEPLTSEWVTPRGLVESSEAHAIAVYHQLLDHGVAPEDARRHLPQTLMTEWWWTGSLAAWHRVYSQRTAGTAQRETADLAARIGEIIEPLYPQAWAALSNAGAGQ